MDNFKYYFRFISQKPLKFLDFMQSCDEDLHQVSPCLSTAQLKVSPEVKDKIWSEQL